MEVTNENEGMQKMASRYENVVKSNLTDNKCYHKIFTLQS